MSNQGNLLIRSDLEILPCNNVKVFLNDLKGDILKMILKYFYLLKSIMLFAMTESMILHNTFFSFD